MNTTIPKPVSRISHIFLTKLMIATKIRLHHDFPKAPLKFAREHGVNLVADVSPQLAFKRNRVTGEKDPKLKANIHLVNYGAIRLFVEMKDTAAWLRNIGLNPAVLLHGDEGHHVTDTDFLRALTRLRIEVAPLLANPSDIQHLVPGLARDAPPLAYWSGLTGEVLLPDVLAPCFHHLSHPATGQAEGTIAKRIQLGDKDDNYLIRLENATWSLREPEGNRNVSGIKTTMKLKGMAVPATFGFGGTTSLIEETSRLICFPASGVAQTLRTLMSKLEGAYLPIPPEWKVGEPGKPITLAKEIALLSAITSIPAVELAAKAKELRKVIPRTDKCLDAAVQKELKRLAPVPVATLFHPSGYAGPSSGVPDPANDIDPTIANVYGER